MRQRRPIWRLSAHTPSSGTLAIGTLPVASPPSPEGCSGEVGGGGGGGGGGKASLSQTPDGAGWVLSQGRDGTLKCWQRAWGASGSDSMGREEQGGHGVEPSQLPPPRTPEWSVSSGAYHFCRFALSVPLGSGGGVDSSGGGPASGTASDTVSSEESYGAEVGAGQRMGTGGCVEGTLLALAGSVTSAVEVCRVHNDGRVPTRINTLIAAADVAAAGGEGGAGGSGGAGVMRRRGSSLQLARSASGSALNDIDELQQAEVRKTPGVKCTGVGLVLRIDLRVPGLGFGVQDPRSKG